MFSKTDIRELIIKLGRRWFFPDFSNKITWAIISLGAGVVLTPTPLKLILYNWLVDTFNLNSGNHFLLAELSSGAADYWTGFALITSAFAHNIFSKWLQLNHEKLSSEDIIAIIEADKVLYKKFIETIPSGSRSIHLLQSHDFGNSFNLESLNEIDNFVSEWNYAESKFLNEELENLRDALWQKSNEFSWLLAKKSAPTAGGRLQSVVPDQHRNDWNWPKWVDDDVKAVNSMASEVVELHQKFIATAKRVLRC
ncbi:hypothetical protein [Stutzerimonas nitrititolerans]|uniref:hypothetical protein n=1 Tax=Stutzerimonas nitrititolerans TaxID=2482751 RepID=UPI0011C3D137|nr:hypothetical protein [Stutzerimonas nitrititolerans]MBA1234555.1 hypothetical protein [Stutzerimonas stutzeri]